MAKDKCVICGEILEHPKELYGISKCGHMDGKPPKQDD